MEDTGAAFASMIMDRLHAVEDTCSLIREENVRLLAKLQQTQQGMTQLHKALHLDRDFRKFSDGLEFYPGFTKTMDEMVPFTQNSTLNNPDDLVLDELHLQATACYGGIQIHPHEECWDDVINVGEAGNHNQRITVRQLVDAINAWCLAPSPSGKAKVDEYMLCSSGSREPYWPFWEGLKYLHFDHHTQRYAYELLISF